MSRSALIVVIFAAAVLVPVGASAAPPGGVDVASSAAADDVPLGRGDESAYNIRRTFHLDSSDEVLSRVEHARPEEVVERFGVTLTLAEADRVDRQLEMEARLDETQRTASQALGDVFAGVWVDRDHDGLVITTTGHAEAARAVLEAVAPGVPIQVKVVERSRADLYRISGELGARADELGITSLGRRPMDNQVVIAVDGDSSETASMLAEQYGSGVVVERSQDDRALVGSRTSGAPWEAGDEIRPTSDLDAYCTGGFGMTRNSVEYVMTAGHCGPVSEQWRVGTTHTLGTLVEGHYNEDADVAIIDTVSSPDWSGSGSGTNCVYISDTDCSEVMSYRDPYVGGTVCYSGVRTGYRCGEVDTERDFVVIGIGLVVYDTLEASGFDLPPEEPGDPLGPCHGDSGSPVFTPYLGSTTFGVIGRGIVSYDASPSPEACSGSMGFSRWSNIQRAVDFEPGCAGNWGEAQGCTNPQYDDVGFNHLHFSEIYWGTDEGIVTGWPDGTFRPDNPTARQAAAAWIWRQAGSPTPPADQNLTDVTPSHPFYDAITWSVGNGIIGYYTSGCPIGNKCFKGTDGLTRADWATALHRRAGSPYQSLNPVPEPPVEVCDVTSGHAAFRAVMWNVVTRVVRADPDWDPNRGAPCGVITQYFEPSSIITRQDAVASLFNFAT